MKAGLVPILAGAGLALAAPAAAQQYPWAQPAPHSWNGGGWNQNSWAHRGGWRNTTINLEREVVQLGRLLDIGYRQGRISPRDAQKIDRKLYAIDRTGQRYARNGLTRKEADRLQRQIAEVRRDLYLAQRNYRPDRRSAGRGW